MIEIDGRCIYLGPYDSPESRTRYHQELAEWEARGRMPLVAPDDLSINELLIRYMKWADGFYRAADGTMAAERQAMMYPLRFVRELYGASNATQFGPAQLKAVRQAMIDAGWTRKSINHQIGRVRRLFKWAVEHGVLPAEVHHGLTVVQPLRRGRTTAPETEPKRPVPMHFIEAIKPHVARQVAALIDLQIYTAARPGELVIMRACDLDTTGSLWLYQPSDHKTKYQGHERVIFIGPRAQRVIGQFLPDRPLDAYLFSPAEAERERRAQIHATRSTPPGYGNRPGTNQSKAPGRPPGERYTTASYRRAIERACDRANEHEQALAEQEGRAAIETPRWTPHRLRHTAATIIRREAGLDAAQAILGHRGLEVTQVYAAVDQRRAEEVLAKIG